MDVTMTANPEEFAGGAGDWLLRQPAENNLLLSHALDPAGQLPGDGSPTFAWVTGPDGDVHGASWSMPPYRMTISQMPSEAAHALAEAHVKAGLTLPGVSGPTATAEAFASAWNELTDQATRRERDQWLMRCDDATRPTGLSGHPRHAQTAEIATIADWFAVSMRDSGLSQEATRRHTQHMVETQIAADRLIVWEDNGEAVGAAGWAQPLAGIARPAGVYISPEHRRGGYAAALLAEVTARALESGCEACTCHHFLDYADMLAVVEKVGFRWVRDVTEYRFG